MTNRMTKPTPPCVILTKREQVMLSWVESICVTKASGRVIDRYKHKCYVKDLTEVGYTLADSREVMSRLIAHDKVCVWWDDPKATSHPMMSAEDMLNVHISAPSQLIWVVPSIWRHA